MCGVLVIFISNGLLLILYFIVIVNLDLVFLKFGDLIIECKLIVVGFWFGILILIWLVFGIGVFIWIFFVVNVILMLFCNVVIFEILIFFLIDNLNFVIFGFLVIFCIFVGILK